MIQPQGHKIIDPIIRSLLDEISKQHITDATMLPLILSNDEKQTENLQIIDWLQQSVLTSLQFGQYRRAVWYLQAFSLACKKTFGDTNRKSVIQTLPLQKYIQL